MTAVTLPTVLLGIAKGNTGGTPGRYLQNLEAAAQGKKGIWLDGSLGAVLACLEAGVDQEVDLVMDGLQKIPFLTVQS